MSKDVTEITIDKGGFMHNVMMKVTNEFYEICMNWRMAHRVKCDLYERKESMREKSQLDAMANDETIW